MKTLYTKNAILFIASLLISCSKDKGTPNRPTALSLLQKTWTSRKTTLYKPSGELAEVQILSTDTNSFTFGSDLFCFWNTSDPRRPYQLLSDDSTLIFEYYNGSTYDKDTNYITTLNENLLTFHGKHSLFIPLLTRDTLRR